MECVPYQVNEMSRKGENELFFITQLQDIHVKLGKCNDAFEDLCSSERAYDLDGVDPGEDADKRYDDKIYKRKHLEGEWLFEDEGTEQCACKRMDNSFATGVEGLSLQFEHQYEVDEARFGDYSSGVNVPTFVHRAGDTKEFDGRFGSTYPTRNCTVLGEVRSPCYFAANELVELSTTQLLHMAGINSLEDINVRPRVRPARWIARLTAAPRACSWRPPSRTFTTTATTSPTGLAASS